MNGERRTLYALFTLFCAASTIAAADRSEELRVVEIGQIGDLSLRLRVKHQATLADDRWLAIEFENRSTTDIKLDHVGYRIEAERRDRQTRTLRSTGGLASGNAYDLFPHAWKTTPASAIIVKPGRYRITDHPSLYSAAVLGLPGKPGWLIRATLHMDVRVAGENQRIDSSQGHPFEFQWLYPDPEGFEKMRVRLHELLVRPRNKVQHAYILHALLGIPEVARSASPAQLLRALGPHQEAFSGRRYIVEHLSDHHADEELVVNQFHDRLVAGDPRILDDLMHGDKIWNMAFLEPLVKLFESDSGNAPQIFVILGQHGSPQQRDPQLARRLSRALLDHGWQKHVEAKDTDPSVVGNDLRTMGRTHDRTVIAKLMPFLSDTSATVTHFPAWSGFGRLPPLRVCDNALEAILTILDGNAHKAYEQAGYTSPDPELGRRPEAVTAIRDKMIATLKKRLARLMIDPER